MTTVTTRTVLPYIFTKSVFSPQGVMKRAFPWTTLNGSPLLWSGNDLLQTRIGLKNILMNFEVKKFEIINKSNFANTQ
jgi:hypothetical protein